LQQEPWRREKLHANINYFIQQAAESNLTLISEAPTAIKSILIGDNQAALDMQLFLQQHGYLVPCIRPPTVAKNTARLRISLNCMHEQKDILRIIQLIVSKKKTYAKIS
jgi:8-amino-7-oxononanoate synthase